MTRVAAGFLIFRRITENVEYLLLQASYGEHHWSPPKGHTDPGETNIQTAFRETFEETGLKESDLKVFENETHILRYDVKGKPKTVHYWLAELINTNATVKISDEHQEFKWLPLDEACKLAKYEDMVNLLRTCHASLTK
ncbi:hypothetical protein WA026_020156 [Henosepilachna vigintioctopunctata]|uniref:Bis(5'-nucleosyl)-tetraphosphatase [asymmetrical] n=1 Tax=Henosepilachna vigintioctopunctata TaxID=420089 RepID=A0AAW1UA31_9CUCU